MLGSRLIKSYPVGQRSNEAKRRHKILRELVVACRDTSPVFEPAEATLHDIAVLVSFLVVADFLFAIGFAWNDGFDAMLFEESSNCIRIIAFIGEKLFDSRDQADAFLGHDTIGRVAGGQDKGPRPAFRIDNRVDFAVLATFRKPDRLKIRPPFPPLAQRWTFT